MDNTRETQQNEIAVLQAIFADDYRDVVARTAWNVKQSAPEFVIRVRPTDGDLKDRVSVGLHVRLPRAYPRAAPQLTLEDGRGLSDTQLAAALAMVRQQADALVGNEMVYELAVALGEHLTAHNSAAQAEQPSFHQQMVDRERAGREADRERAAEQRRVQQRADAEEKQALQTRIRAELERKQQQQAQSDEQHRHHLGAVAEAVHSVAGRWAEGIQLLQFAQPLALDPQTAHCGFFSTVALEEADGSSDSLCTVFDAYPTDLEGATMHLADRFTAQCFAVTARYYLAEPGSRQIERVRARVVELAQIRHDNMVTVYGAHMEVQHEHGGNPALCLWVLSDALLAAGGSTLEDVLASCGAIAARQACVYLQHILRALASLHVAGFVHRGVMPSNVLVVKESPGKFVAKLFNTSYREELLALHRATPLSAAIGDAVGTDTRVAPEVVDRPDMMGRKNDIWCVGVIGLQMVLGMDALRGVPIGGEPQVLAAHRSAMPPALFDLLARMLTADHRVRPTAIDALDSPLFYQGPNVHRQALDSASRVLTLDPRNVEGERPQRPSRVERALRPSTSRYRTDFEEVGFLGKGGFGSVVKARNRIDGRFYAIKKIPLDPRDSDSNKKIFREVTTLSRLHHHHVVRYYTTWVENVDVVDYDSDSDDGSDDSSAAGDGFGAHLSHSSWSTEGDPEAESGYSSSESKGTGGDNHGSTSGSGALDEPHSHAAMLARPAGSRTDVFSAIRFGTMGSGSSAAHKRAVPSGPVREFAIESTDSQSDSQASEVATESDSALRNMLRRDQLKYDRERQTTHQSRLRKRDTRRQILYIQMEYCENKTLSDLLREGIDEKTCWRLFAQILEGLKHIHQCGVIHRDLKPVNAFLDAAGEVKIGDFGLATSSFAQIDPGLRHLSLDRSVEDGLTADIGTAMYVAPEATAAMSGGNTMRYNQKVDMYSLGIIFFEMCYPMGTGMERATVLHGLRKPEIVFPADFDVDRMQLQHQIIRQLLSHSPRQRPSSAELLESGLLPPRVEDGHIHETIRAIANPAQPHFSKLMDALFVQAADKHIDATFDFRAGDVQAEQLNSVFLDRIRELMTRVFRTHAAVELSTPAVMPHADLLGVHHRPATYVDPRGTVVQLAYDQTAPFARYVARTRMTEIKRYCFGRCFAANAAGGQPVSHSTASFDAVTTRSVHAVAAGEVVSVACEVFNELPAFRGVPTVLLVNHMSVLDAVLAYCGILHPEWTAGEDARPDDSQRHAQFVRSVCDCLSAAVHREKAPAVRQRIQIMAATMGVRVHSQTLDRLQQFLAIRGDIGAIQREVLARIGSACGVAGTRYATAGAAYVQAAIQAFGELRQVETSVRQFGAAVPVACVPLFSLNYAYYRGGYAFQLMTDRPAARRQQPQVLAAGGRCDGLLRHFRHLADEGLGDSARDVVCVGVQIPLDMVVEEMALYQQQVLSVAAPATPTFGLWTRKRCDVVVASFGAHPMLRQRVALARELWASGLRTDFLYKDDPEMTMERLVDICRDQGMNWIVTLKRRAGTPSLSDQLSATRYTFKVKNILRRVESEVSHENLCDWLHTDIAEQNRMDLQIHGQRSTAPSSEPAAAGMPAAGATTTATAETAAASALVGRGGRLEVVVVDPQRKAKHVNRARYKYRTGLTDRAQAAVTRVLGDVRGAPVLVVDEGPELVRRMAGEQSILSDAGYKRVVEQSSPHQRAYIVELRALLERYHREGTAHVWLYAAKGDIAIAYTL